MEVPPQDCCGNFDPQIRNNENGSKQRDAPPRRGVWRCTGTRLICLLLMIDGFATAEGTRRFADRFAALQTAGHFRQPKHAQGVSELWFSSLGLGTYLGDPD